MSCSARDQFGWPHSFAAPKFKKKSSYIIIVGHLPPCRYIKKLPIIVSAILISLAPRDRKRGSRLFGNKRRGCGLPSNLTRNLRCSGSKMPGTNQIRTNDEICLYMTCKGPRLGGQGRITNSGSSNSRLYQTQSRNFADQPSDPSVNEHNFSAFQT